MEEKTDNTYFTDHSGPGKRKGGTIVVISEASGVPEIVSLGENRDALPNQP